MKEPLNLFLRILFRTITCSGRFNLIKVSVMIFCILGCKDLIKLKSENTEGYITYKVTYDEDNPFKNNRFLPDRTTLVFKGNKAGFYTSGMGMIEVVNTLDNENKKFTSFLINSFGDNYAFTEIPEDIAWQENNPKYTFELTEEQKTIAGIACNRAIVTDNTNKHKFDIYFYKEINIALGSSPYKNFNYLLMEYRDTRFGLPMHLLATKAEFSEVDASLLNVESKGEFNWVDRKTFLSVINNLKLPI